MNFKKDSSVDGFKEIFFSEVDFSEVDFSEEKADAVGGFIVCNKEL